MIGTSAAQATLVIYAILLLVGGLIGFLKAGSRPSLIAGTTSGALAITASVLMGRDTRWVWLGIALALAMMVVFSIRYRKGRKFMPSGLLGIVSLVVLIVLAFSAV